MNQKTKYVAVIDLGTIIFETVDKKIKSNKVTTMWVKNGSMVKRSLDNPKDEEIWNFEIKLPPFKSMSPVYKKQWFKIREFSKRSSGKIKSDLTDDQSDAKNCKDVLEMLLEEVDDGETITFARGKYAEERFLNGLGINGKTISKKDYNSSKRGIRVHELGTFAPKYPKNYKYRCPANEVEFFLEYVYTYCKQMGM